MLTVRDAESGRVFEGSALQELKAGLKRGRMHHVDSGDSSEEANASNDCEKREKRRRQVAEAARRCRQKRKIEIESLRNRVKQLEDQLAKEKKEGQKLEKQGLVRLDRVHYDGVHPSVLEAVQENDLLKSQLKTCMRMSSELEKMFRQYGPHQARNSQPTPRPTVLALPRQIFCITDVCRIRAEAFGAIEGFRSVFRSMKEDSLSRALLESNKWTVSSVNYPSNVVIRFSRKLQGIAVEPFAKAVFQFFLTEDMSWRSLYDPFTQQAEVLQRISESDAIVRDVFRLDSKSELEGTHLISVQAGIGGSWLWAGPALQSKRELAPTRKTVDILRGMVFEEYREESGRSGLMWHFFFDNRISSHNTAKITPRAVASVIFRELFRLEVGVLELYRTYGHSAPESDPVVVLRASNVEGG